MGVEWVRRLTDVARSQFKADRVCLIVFPDNEPAIRAYNAAGFDYAAEEVHQFRPDLGPQTLHRYEWRF